MKMISKINARSLGDAQEYVKTLPQGQTRALFGTIYGEAVGVSSRASADGEGRQEGLQGIFATVPEKGDPVMSKVLFLPGASGAPVIKLFHDKKPPAAMHVAYDIFVVRESNEIGYVWEVVPLIADNVTNDALATVSAKLAAKRKDKKK